MAKGFSVPVLVAVLTPAVGRGLVNAQLVAGCTATSFTTPSWLVDDFQYRASQNTTVVSFQALNRATDTAATLRCQSAAASLATGWPSCSVSFQNSKGESLTAAIQVDKSTASFLFNETWNCGNTDTTKP